MYLSHFSIVSRLPEIASSRSFHSNLFCRISDAPKKLVPFRVHTRSVTCGIEKEQSDGTECSFISGWDLQEPKLRDDKLCVQKPLPFRARGEALRQAGVAPKLRAPGMARGVVKRFFGRVRKPTAYAVASFTEG